MFKLPFVTGWEERRRLCPTLPWRSRPFTFLPY